MPNVKPIRREGRTIRDILDVEPTYRIKNEEDGGLTRGSDRKITFLHECSIGVWNEFVMSISQFACGHGCQPCARARTIIARKRPRDFESSILAFKDELLERGVKLVASDEELREIAAKGSVYVDCECAAGLEHPKWSTRAHNLVINQSGCMLCGRLKTAEALSVLRSTPKDANDSLASLLGRLEELTRSFVRLANTDDTRTPEEIKKMANDYAIWLCLDCGNEWTSKICHVVNGTKCPECSTIGSTEKIVVQYLRKICEKVDTQHRLGEYKVDARVMYKGEELDTEIDGIQHYEYSKIFKSMKLDDQINRDVEKMRRAYSEGVPTVRIPTVAVRTDARLDKDIWKILLLEALEKAAKLKSLLKISSDILPMVIINGHEDKYIKHAEILKNVIKD